MGVFDWENNYEDIAKVKNYKNRKKEALTEMLRDFARDRDYYLNYGHIYADTTTFVFYTYDLSNNRVEYPIDIIWDELENIFDAFECIKQEVDKTLKWNAYDLKLTKETMDYMRHDLASTQLAIYTMMCEPKTEILKSVPKIEKVVFNDPATIVFWADKTKTVVKAGLKDIFDPEKGLAMAIAKKALGNQGNYYNTIKKWLPEEKEPEPMSLDRFLASVNKLNSAVRAIWGLPKEEPYEWTKEESEEVEDSESDDYTWDYLSGDKE